MTSIFDAQTEVATVPMLALNCTLSIDALLAVTDLPSVDDSLTGSYSAFPLLYEPLDAVDLAELRTRTIPHKPVLALTARHASRAESPPALAFLDLRFRPPRPAPVWMLTFWNQAVLANDARMVWGERRAFLQGLIVRYGSDCAEGRDAGRALSMFSTLPWNENVHAEPVVHSRDLLALITDTPLSDIVVNTLIHIVRHDTHASLAGTSGSGIGRGVSIQSVALQPILTSLPVVDSRGVHEVDMRLLLARGMAAPLGGTRPRVHSAYVPWSSDGHYRLYLVDTTARVIRHGCMAGTPPPDVDLRLIRRWLALVDSGEWPVGDPLAFGAAEDARDEGLALVNAIRHRVLGDALWEHASRDIHRVREFLRVIAFMCS